MKRIAVFVDAGYLYAQGSACLQGNKAKRENIRLNHVKFIQFLKDLVRKAVSDVPLLRIYWYDGTSRGPTQDHRQLAELDDLKLRLGFINSVGQQKGVDSLLVTDLVELARNGAICDALLLGGDEDLRIGVQIAQSFGVRVHLIGIEPSRGSQSGQLRQESDTNSEIAANQIPDFLSLIAPSSTLQNLAVLAGPGIQTSASLKMPVGATGQSNVQTLLDQGIEAAMASFGSTGVADLQRSLAVSTSVPSVYDGRVLASSRTALGRDLTMEEKKEMRSRLILKLRQVQP